MIKIYKAAFILLFLVTAYNTYGQSKYFEVVFDKDNTSGGVMPLNNKVRFYYQGKSKEELLTAVLKYLKERPSLKLDMIVKEDVGDGRFLVYRDFASIGTKDKCFADLIALSFMYVSWDEGYVSMRLGATSTIFATIDSAQLRISPSGIVASENDVPFNEYKFVQPEYNEELAMSNARSILIGNPRAKKISLKEAYLDCVFDGKGKVINPVNKKIIEDFYDGYATDLKNYLDNNLK